MIIRHTFDAPDNARLARVCGPLDAHLRDIEASLGVQVVRREATFRIDGPKRAAEATRSLLDSLYAQARRSFGARELQLLLAEASASLQTRARRGVRADAATAGAADAADAATPAAGDIVLHTRRNDLEARTPNQHRYLRSIFTHDISFGIGPAGTGKTFLAVACAIDALERSQVQRIVLTRPAVEAGERLGFLPGDLTQKVDPYLRPLYDALYDLMGFDRVTKAFEKGLLEIAPLAFMRGRTLNQAFVILDEAQNTTPEQMKMFLTRIGFGAKAVVTGDTSQIDLPRGVPSGLLDAERVLAQVKGIGFTRFNSSDVVRHPLVARIVDAYDAAKVAADGLAPRGRTA